MSLIDLGAAIFIVKAKSTHLVSSHVGVKVVRTHCVPFQAHSDTETS
jgi:hypothetical protein